MHYGKCICYSDDYVWMQYTGLKDKSNVEIYSGDIINCSFTLRDKESQFFESVAVECDTTWGATISPHDVYSLGRCEDIEIIGNIYTTPELLK